MLKQVESTPQRVPKASANKHVIRRVLNSERRGLPNIQGQIIPQLWNSYSKSTVTSKFILSFWCLTELLIGRPRGAGRCM